MSKLHYYGVVCKNQKCGNEIPLGTYRPPTTEMRGGESIDFVTINLGELRCPDCGRVDTYTDDDRKDFGRAKMGVNHEKGR